MNRRRGIAVLLVVVCVVALVFVVQTQRTYRIATPSKPSDGYFLALTYGLLDGRANLDGTACLWLGSGPDARALFWPYGYYAKGFPLAVYDQHGTRVAQTGQQLWIGGGLAADGWGPILGCSAFPHVWLASPLTPT